MSRHREEHLELCAALVLGALDESDRIELASHRAAGCTDCEREIVRLEAAARLLAESAPAVTPPASLKVRTLAAVAAEVRAVDGRASVAAPVSDSARASAAEPASPSARARRIVPIPERRSAAWMPWAFAAAAAFLAVTSVGLWREGDRLRATLDSTRRLLAESEQRLLDERRWTAVLDALDARAVSLAPTADGAPELRGRGTWDPSTGRAVIVFEHVTPPSGRDYELWGIHPSGPKSLGVVTADALGRAIVRLENAGDAATLQAFAISLEPAGGSPNPNAPTGPVVMVGQVPS